jgi:lipopolysaccharide transport system ATP-binding protein
MSDYIIKVENLGKKYSIQHQGERESYVALRDVVAGGVKGVGSSVLSGLRSWVPGLGSSLGNGYHPTNGTISQNPKPKTQPQKPITEDFWALKNVSFEVKQGEVLGIIGRNGAGKSTLLKILSRITEPTEGRVRIRGRVASLLEVGTGFHPELTGRENIFVNGAILGMARAEISKKFDEIVAFAEVEQFLDTPVKRYSSGMYVRLAFAVAAHLEPEILVVDEVLAVGDTRFQKKCLGKMHEVSDRDGRTVFFVSHHMDMVKALCPRCVLLMDGRVLKTGPTDQVVDAYSGLLFPSTQRAEFLVDDDPAAPIRVTAVRLTGTKDGENRIIDFNEPVEIEVEYVVHRAISGAVVNFELLKDNFPILLSFDTDENPERLDIRRPGKYFAEIAIAGRILKPGEYTLNVNTGRANGDIWQRLEACIGFSVDVTNRNASNLSYAAKRSGIFAYPMAWRTSEYRKLDNESG